MQIARRIFLFLLTNIAVIVTLMLTLQVLSAVFGVSLHGDSLISLAIFAAVWGMGGAFISLLMSRWMAKMMMRVKVIPTNTTVSSEREILDMTHRLARMAGLTVMPEVGIYESPEINAFATGPSKSRSLVAFSTGLLNSMSRDEIEGVAGHEIAHIANGDMVTLTLIQGIVNAFVIFLSRLIAKVISSQVNENSRMLVYVGLTFVLDLVFSIFGMMVVAYFSRLREFRADLGGARYAGKEKMIAGLKRLLRQYGRLETDNSSIAAFKISSKSSGILQLFSTHPPLEERIYRLENRSHF